MPKLNTPLLSFEAHGTVGNAITFQGDSRVKIARKKPRLPYSLTLSQQYQRWLYEDYAYLWRQQSYATQRYYASQGVRFHLTGYQYWMKDMLSNLPDISSWWKLDTTSSAVALDSGKMGNNGVIIGASPVPGQIDGQLEFDGINDEVRIPATPDIFTGDTFTFVSFMEFPVFGNFEVLFMRWDGVSKDVLLYKGAGNNIAWRLLFGGVALTTATAVLPLTNTRYAVAGRYNGVNVQMFVDGLPSGAPQVKSGDIDFTPTPMSLGCEIFGAPRYGEFLCDNFITFNRALDDTEILRWSGRRYSL